MNISEIKKEIGVEKIDFYNTWDADGVITKWLKNWDNDKRVMILMHEDVDTDSDQLHLKMDTKTAKETSEQYTKYTIVQRQKVVKSV